MRISLVVPVFNEEEAVPAFYAAVRHELGSQAFDTEIVFVNDGSTDQTDARIHEIAATDPLVRCITFTRNFGKEPALFAGLQHTTGDAVVPIDVDLQDPVDLIPDLVEKWLEGFDVVLAKRRDRSVDSAMKRSTATLFYRLHNLISTPKIEDDVGDFRLLDRQIVETITRMPERNLFMKGILSWVGGETAIIEYRRATRCNGESKFNGWRLWNLALEGLTSFSTVPLRIWTYIGLSISFLSFVFGTWMVIDKLVWGNAVPGYPSLFTAVLFFGGVQLIGIGVMGEYIGRIYIESKRRPRYVIRKKRPTDA